MTILPIYKRCKKCGKKYSWNPDVGQISCPRCGGLGIPMPGKKRRKGGPILWD